MTGQVFGAPLRRKEDQRFLTGSATYIDDIELPDMLHAAILRSPYAHAHINAIDTAEAEGLEGVMAVFTYKDLGPIAEPLPLLIPHPALTHPHTQYALAKDTVRYVGEAVAMVVAQNRYIAEDALELIEVDYEPLPVVSPAHLAEATSAQAPRIHADAPTNIAAHLIQQVGDIDTAFAQAAHVFRRQVQLERSASQPIEGRGVLARFDAFEQALSVWDSTQGPISIRNGLAVLFGLPRDKVQVSAPDLGGGFGVKIMLFYPEEVLVPLAAIRLKRPVKWVEDRLEHMVASNHERGQVHDIEVAMDTEGHILGLRDIFLHDTGAYCPYGIIVPQITACQLPGPYKLPAYYSEATVVYTNRTPVSPYRGAGRPHGVFAMERIIDYAADQLGLDRAEIRRRNFIQPDEFPYDVGLVFQDGLPTRYDSGNYPAGLEQALQMIGYEQFREEQYRARAQDRYLGIGIGCYVEGTGIGPYEGAHIAIDTLGEIYVATGVSTQGQGHETTFAQIVAQELNVDIEKVHITTGDTRRFHWGTGTYASRAMVVAGNAIGLAARAIKKKAINLAASLLEAAPEDLELVEGRVCIQGSPERGLSLAALSIASNPIRYAYGANAPDLPAILPAPEGPPLPAGTEPGLEATQYFSPQHATFASGVHAAIIEVDIGTGQVKIRKYVVQHDCGKLVNPLVVEGQICGGVAQGIAGSFYEHLDYDDNGQLLNANYMDFLMPYASEIPHLEIGHIETPSPINPLGVKGAGEAGCIPVPALMAAALEDALAPFAALVDHMPLTPSEIRRLAHKGIR
ncbi:xanthine dehydrogenase family protein molybdopterin-binding subunit [Ktedonosporobacter rubrisoli]|uniref:Xanthine dehydrogenase family protein molybdopterin-binding subunit n=1 Tax=Ktedonosporobacter rubrisoli TaxID=2509675 RepID=A0A4P6K3M7_KTERU|nr:aerobic carbon-monoxide dehydrogenase large subunit [Ktedonosporobacter rubrisoli]QBD82754.1 xanthine dehydrogenase family protein molybdopterin-binding subunit [Ktedonosporobacter rubrisoli]